MSIRSRKTVRPLWQLLLLARNASEGVTLSCDDCFLILEYLADTNHKNGADADFLGMIARKHLSCCPDCRQFYLQRLEQLEQSLADSGTNTTK